MTPKKVEKKLNQDLNPNRPFLPKEVKEQLQPSTSNKLKPEYGPSP